MKSTNSNYTAPMFDYPMLVEQLTRARRTSHLIRLLIVVLCVAGLNNLEKKATSTALFTGALISALAGKAITGTVASTDRRINDISAIAVSAGDQQLYRAMTADNPEVETANVVDILAGSTEGTNPVELPASTPEADSLLELYDLADIAGENHTAIVGESGSGKSVLAQHLIETYFPSVENIAALDTDAAPDDWPGINVIGKGFNITKIRAQFNKDIKVLQHRTNLRAAGKPVGDEVIRIVEEYPSVNASIDDQIDQEYVINKSLAEKGEVITKDRNTAYDWMRQMLRRGRKYRMKAVFVSQGYSAKAFGIEGETELLEALTVIFLGAKAHSTLDKVRDRKQRGELRAWIKAGDRRALVNSGGRWYGCQIPTINPSQKPIITTPVEPPETETFTADESDIEDSISVTAYAAKIANSPIGTSVIKLDTESPETSKPLHLLFQNLLNTGETKSSILKSHLNLVGANYEKGKKLWEFLETTHGEFHNPVT